MKGETGHKGKTLMETMIIVSVLGIAALIAADALLPATRHTQGQAVLAEVAGELRLARQLAMTRGRAVRARLEAGRSRLTIESIEDGAVLRTLDFSEKGIAIGSVSNGSEILFYGSGRAASPSTVILKSTEDDTFSTLTVSITGRVTLK